MHELGSLPLVTPDLVMRPCQVFRTVEDGFQAFLRFLQYPARFFQMRRRPVPYLGVKQDEGGYPLAGPPLDGTSLLP